MHLSWRACLLFAFVLVCTPAVFAQEASPAAPDYPPTFLNSPQAGSADSAASAPSSDVTSPLPPSDRDPLEVLNSIWNATLFTAGDTEIKLNQLVIALLVVILGMWLAKGVTGLISRRLVRVSKVSDSVAFNLGKVMYYFAAAMVILIAMQVAGIPTTVFTVVGGALAIGVGFGAQNLFNNLISGIIILTEKPIRRKDIVEIDGMQGQVAEIGNRRTRIRRTDGIDVLVPNSTFLETNVINWTLHDAKVRGEVGVGVEYGSPVEKVRELLLQAAREHECVDDKPPPAVLFTEFGDNTLNFLMYIWTHVQNPLDRQQIESDLRFRIDALLRESGITIAFPQTDVHLDTLRPLEVRMVGDQPTPRTH